MRYAPVRAGSQPGEILGEDLLGDLASACHLHPVAGVGGGGDDVGLDGRRRHACQQHGRAASEASKPSIDDPALVPAVLNPRQFRLEDRPIVALLPLDARVDI